MVRIEDGEPQIAENDIGDSKYQKTEKEKTTRNMATENRKIKWQKGTELDKGEMNLNPTA